MSHVRDTKSTRRAASPRRRRTPSHTHHHHQPDETLSISTQTRRGGGVRVRVYTDPSERCRFPSERTLIVKKRKKKEKLRQVATERRGTMSKSARGGINAEAAGESKVCRPRRKHTQRARRGSQLRKGPLQGLEPLKKLRVIIWRATAARFPAGITIQD